MLNAIFDDLKQPTETIFCEELRAVGFGLTDLFDDNDDDQLNRTEFVPWRRVPFLAGRKAAARRARD